MRAFFAIPTAGGGFFFSSWLAMVFWGIFASNLGLRTMSYVESMVVTIAVWLVVAPLVGAVVRKKG